MKKGFTLIELSIVLIIIGLLTGGVFQMIKVMQEKARATEAKQTLQSAKEAVITYAINNGFLPTESDFLKMQIRGADNFNLSYYVPNDPVISSDFLTTNLCAKTDTLFSTQITKPDDTLEIATPNIAFVIAINGENMQRQTIPLPPTAPSNPLIFPRWNAITPTTGGFPYDDLHVQVTLGELQSKADCQTNKLQIINTSLPTGTAGIAYSVSPAVIASGGKSPYTYQLTANTSASTFTAGTNTITWATPIAGNYLLTFTATDSVGTISAPKELVLTINADPTVGGTGAYNACVDGCIAGGKNQTACENSCKKYQ